VSEPTIEPVTLCLHCGRKDCACKNYELPPRGRKLTARELRTMRTNLEGRDNNSGSPYWTERVHALLDHIELQDAELEQVRRPLLPGIGGAR
jgi:hypothetical protein